VTFPPHNVIDENGKKGTAEVAKGLRIFKRPNAPIQVLLMGHLDTVHALSSPFQAVTVQNDTLVGPGVTDMKGGIAVMLHALSLFEQTENHEKIGWEVLLNSDEEIGSLSSSDYICSRAKDFDLGLVYEPATEAGDIVIERKGSSNFTLIANGVAAHVGRYFKDGQSAISDMALLIHNIQQLPISSEIILNFGLIHGGSATNTVPDLCLCHGNIRADNMDQMTEFFTQTNALISTLNDAEKKRHLELVKVSERPPKRSDALTQKLYDHALNLVREKYPSTQLVNTGGSSDGNYLAHSGLPTIDTLGVMGSGIHTENETMINKSIEERAQLTCQILDDLANAKISLTH